MTSSLPSPLPVLDRTLLYFACKLVPLAERSDWLRCWQAELWHRHHLRSSELRSNAIDLYPGLVRDALWLCAESIRMAFAGTASLCLGLLTIVLVLAGMPLFAFSGSTHTLFGLLPSNAGRFLCEATLVTLVSFATGSRTIEHESPAALVSRFRAQFFLAAKLALVLIIAFLLSLDMTLPFHTAHPFIAEIIQPQFFVFIALLGLRWNFQDQDNRCKHCLRELASPSRVGRPSWNFLDSNSTELLCKDGHGLLSVPEIETSWRRSSHWIAS